MRNLLALAAAALAGIVVLAPTASALPKVSRAGKYLYTEDGNRFFIKGIAYQTQGLIVPGPDNPLNQPSTFVDNLADAAACARDLPNLQKLGINAIRAYAANSSLNHDECMQALSSAGIYVIRDVCSYFIALNGSIDTTLPAWSTNTLDQYLRTIDAFEKYDNILAYNIGNEVITPKATQSPPFIAAAARDIRAYLNSISSSALVGYAAIDGAASFVLNEANFLACSATGSIDLFGLNNYECSEFGSENCNPAPRVWTEIPVMFSEPMTNVWSGGLAFSYFGAISKGHEFGMAVPSSDGTSVTTNADFDNPRGQVQRRHVCQRPREERVDARAAGVTPDDAACGCLANELSCVFQPPTPDYMALVGNLIGVACGLVQTAGGTCDDISSDGVKGTYGRLAMCDPTIKLSYVMSQYYELQHRVNTACSFRGNATINANAKPNLLASAAASSCIPSAAVFTPSAPPVLIPGAGAKTNTTSAGNAPGGSTTGGANCNPPVGLGKAQTKSVQGSLQRKSASP
ncbi:1,3-beta-glucanosyltransferase [Mycena olivaceomarginata]|nr:1,3-beta-glucanosyltransferase [Mycena olivaceomarginata]